MDRRTFIASVGSAAVVGSAGCLASGSPDLADNEIGMGTRRFVPEERTVPAGTTVVWRNTDRGVHTVSAYADGIPEGTDYFASGGFDTEQAARDGWFAGTEGGIDPQDTYEYTFEQPGTYNYFCIPHERAGMVGTVVVD
jgi:plastocyanin